MNQIILGFFDKPLADEYQEALEDAGVDLRLEDAQEKSNRLRKIKFVVAREDYIRAVELIKNLEVKSSIQAKENAKAFERKTIIIFFIFVMIFIAYIIFSHV